MGKTYELRKSLNSILKQYVDRVYYEQSPDGATHPYVVFEMSELSHDDGKTLMEMELNVVDYGTDTSEVEELADTLQKNLNKMDYINAFIQFSVYRGLRERVEEEDKQIIRRRLTFEVHLNERSTM